MGELRGKKRGPNPSPAHENKLLKPTATPRLRTTHSMRRRRHTPKLHTRNTAFLHRNDGIKIAEPPKPASHQFWGQAAPGHKLLEMWRLTHNRACFGPVWHPSFGRLQVQQQERIGTINSRQCTSVVACQKCRAERKRFLESPLSIFSRVLGPWTVCCSTPPRRDCTTSNRFWQRKTAPFNGEGTSPPLPSGCGPGVFRKCGGCRCGLFRN
jgi:hypothetical protein